MLMAVLSTVLKSSASTPLAPDERFRENSLIENDLNSVNVQGKGRVINSDVCNSNAKTFQLKMFWEDGMEWQDSPIERGWCVERYDCIEKARVYIRECDGDDDKQKFIFEKCTVRPVCDPKLCFTAGVAFSESDRGNIQLRTCDPNDDDQIQHFETFDPKAVSKKFQFKLFGRDDFCLSQQHHPTDWETVKFEDCKVAERNDEGVYDDTSHWVVGQFDGHFPTAPIAPTNPPTRNPTRSPTRNPTKEPTRNPTKNPTRNPTKNPTNPPTSKPKKTDQFT